MKIVFLSPFGIRPKGSLIARLLPLAKELDALNHQVTIIAPPYTNPEDSGKTEVVDGITIRNIDLGTGNKIKATIQNSQRMYKAALEEAPDLIHLFKPKGYGGLASMYLSLKNDVGFSSVPLFVDTDDWEGKGGMNDIQPYSASEKWLFDFQERWLPQRAVGVSVASLALKEQVQSRGVSENRILYLPNCVESKKKGDGTAIRERYGIGARTPVVLLYTRFFEFSQERLYFVFKALATSWPGVRFMVVGQGRQGEHELLELAAKESGFSSNLVMAGWVEPEDIPDYLDAADVAIYPLDDTLINRSKCPAKLTEIMLAGCPVVSDRIGQATEYVRHEDNGILVDPESPDDMAKAVLFLLNNEELRIQYGENAKAYLLERFNWKNAAEKLNFFYEACLSPTDASE